MKKNDVKINKIYVKPMYPNLIIHLTCQLGRFMDISYATLVFIGYT